ncbi:MAG: hypothetical protein AAFZ65_08495 [Planctomycetota bacterium]
MRSTIALLSLLASCTSLTPAGAGADHAALRATIEELYTAFSFDAHAEPDWARQRELYLEGATFVAPIQPGQAPVGDDTETFLDEFQAFVRRGPYAETGLYERILDVDAGICGNIAHAFVLFEGHYPGDPEAQTRGLDSLQFVRDGQAWRLVSFTTQYESEGAPLELVFKSSN